jgi:hypothetical protein
MSSFSMDWLRVTFFLLLSNPLTLRVLWGNPKAVVVYTSNLRKGGKQRELQYYCGG